MSVKTDGSVELKDVIKATTLANMAKVTPGITIGDEGVAKVEKSLFEDFLPEDLDISTVQRAQQAMIDFTDATGGAFGEKSIEFLKSNKDVSKTTFSCKAGLMTVEGSVSRNKDIRNVQSGEITVRHGDLVHGAQFKNSKKTGQMKHLRSYLAALGDELIG